MSASLSVDGSPVKVENTSVYLGKLAVGTKIAILIPVEKDVLCFVQAPKTNAIDPKGVKDGLWIKNLTVVKLDDGRVVVQGWPGNGMYTARRIDVGQVELTFHAVVAFNGEFFYVEDEQVVFFHNLLGRPFTTQLRGSREVVDHIMPLIAADELPVATSQTDPAIGTVLWYSRARSIGAVVISFDEHEEIVCARVHISQICTDKAGLPALKAGQTVSWEGVRELPSGGNTTFPCELEEVKVI